MQRIVRNACEQMIYQHIAVVVQKEVCSVKTKHRAVSCCRAVLKEVVKVKCS
jgi:hypothetical protein